jgi:hypothetical protein
MRRPRNRRSCSRAISAGGCRDHVKRFPAQMRKESGGGPRATPTRSSAPDGDRWLRAWRTQGREMGTARQRRGIPSRTQSKWRRTQPGSESRYRASYVKDNEGGGEGEEGERQLFDGAEAVFRDTVVHFKTRAEGPAPLACILVKAHRSNLLSGPQCQVTSSKLYLRRGRA